MTNYTAPSGKCELPGCNEITREGGSGKANRFCTETHRERYYQLLARIKNTEKNILQRKIPEKNRITIKHLLEVGYKIKIQREYKEPITFQPEEEFVKFANKVLKK